MTITSMIQHTTGIDTVDTVEETEMSLPPGTFMMVDHNGEDSTKETILSPTPTDDPDDPLNWSIWRKAWAYALILAVTIAVFTALSIQLNFWTQMSEELGFSYQQLNNSVSANSAGLTLGCLFFIPLTKKYGRRSTYVVSTIVMAAVTWWTAHFHTLTELYLTNLFFGLAGATNETIVQMTIADLFFVHQRGRANALYLGAVMIGSFLIPMAAGVQADAQGWRQSYVALAISLTILSVTFIVSCEETKYVAVIDGVSDPVAVHETDNTKQLASSKTERIPVVERTTSAPAKSPKKSRKTYLQRMRFFTTSPGSLWKIFYYPIYVAFFPHVLFTSLQYATGVLWLVILSSVTSIAFSAPPYNFDTAGLGYMNLGPFVGNIFGSVYAGVLGDWTIKVLAKRNKGYYEPEFRLYTLLPPSLFMSGGLIMYGITVDRGMHWIYPSIGGALFAFGLGAIGDAALTIIIDSYQPLTGEAFITVAFFRNVLGIPISFAIVPWMENGGLTQMFLVCGFISLFVSFLFVPLIIYGKRIRIHYAARYEKLLEQLDQIHK